MTKEELDMFIQYLWEEEYERRCKENGVLKELREEYLKELSNEQN